MNEVKFMHASDIMLSISGLAIKHRVPVSVTRMPRGCGYFLYAGLCEQAIRLDTGLRELYSYTEEEWDKTYNKIDEELSEKVHKSPCAICTIPSAEKAVCCGCEEYFEWKKNESEEHK